MDELRKIRKVIAGRVAGRAPRDPADDRRDHGPERPSPGAAVPARPFEIDGIALTKLDGTAKGGIALAIAQELEVPVKLIGIGEALEDLRPFDPDDFAAAILSP